MFRDTGDAGDGGPSPESKTIPPDSLESWKEVLEKVGLSAALSTAFRDVYSGVVNAASAKTFQEALYIKSCRGLMRVGELGLVDVEPLALALASVET